jgi:hypothetical protein
MTSFQLRNREKSLFRGMELLLDYRDPALPDIPYFCPVLVFRNTTLDRYLPWPERERRPGDREIPVVEVIDLLGGLARSQRRVPTVSQLVTSLRQTLVRPERRSTPKLVVIDDVRQPSYASPEPVAPVDPYAVDEDPQTVRELEGRFAASGFRNWDYTAWFEAHAPIETRERFGPQLVTGGYRFRTADELRFFERLEGLDRVALQLIAAKSPVFRVPAGTLLLDRGTRDSWNLYLLSGDLELMSPDGASYLLAGGSPSARRPVAFLKPRLFTVVARGEVEFLWLYEPMIEAVKRLYPGTVEPSAPSAR